MGGGVVVLVVYACYAICVGGCIYVYKYIYAYAYINMCGVYNDVYMHVVYLLLIVFLHLIVIIVVVIVTCKLCCR